MATNNYNNSNYNTPTIVLPREDSRISDDDYETVPSSTIAPRSYLEDQDEGVLHDVLQELDRERTMRAELEAKVRKLEQTVHSQKRHLKDQHQTTTSSSSSSSSTGNNNTATASSGIPRTKNYIALEAEKDGYLELLEELTKDRPAFAAAAAAANQKNQKKKKKRYRNNDNNTMPTLPLHVLRLLEIIPYDPRTKPYLFGEEHVYEWQMWSAQKNWQKELRYFPTFFKTLPIVIPQPGCTVGDDDTNDSVGGIGGILGIKKANPSSSPPKRCVLTNLDVTKIFNIDDGYPLPQDGGIWQWIGGWRIEKTMDTDNKGWSYSNSTEIVPSKNTNDDNDSQQQKQQSLYCSEHKIPKKGEPNLVKRRRKWIRSRVLIDYPHACTSTKEYLKLVAEQANLAISCQKLSNQLVETKMKLTTLEDDHVSLQDETTRKIQLLEKENEEKNQILSAFEGVAPDVTNTKSSTKEQVKELKSLLTKWVTDTVQNKQQDGENYDDDDDGGGGKINTAAYTNNHHHNNDSGHDGNTIDSDEQLSDEEYGGGNRTVTTPTTTTKQQLFASWAKGKGPDILEKLKQTGGQGIEKIRQTGVVEKIKHTSVVEKIKQKTSAAASSGSGGGGFLQRSLIKQSSSTIDATTITPDGDGGGGGEEE